MAKLPNTSETSIALTFLVYEPGEAAEAVLLSFFVFNFSQTFIILS